VGGTATIDRKSGFQTQPCASLVDVRCHHGYVVAAGSEANGKELPDEIMALAVTPGDRERINSNC